MLHSYTTIGGPMAVCYERVNYAVLGRPYNAHTATIKCGCLIHTDADDVARNVLQRALRHSGKRYCERDPVYLAVLGRPDGGYTAVGKTATSGPPMSTGPEFQRNGRCRLTQSPGPELKRNGKNDFENLHSVFENQSGDTTGGYTRPYWTVTLHPPYYI